MFVYDVDKLKTILSEIIGKNVQAGAWNWLKENSGIKENTAKFNAAFAVVPRKTGRAPIRVTTDQQEVIHTARPNFSIQGWTTDGLCRAWLLLHLDPADKDTYLHTIENLFLAAEMNEQVALYSALPLLAYPPQWRRRCAEGIRSNIGDVLQAIMCSNPYPSENLEELAWNQMVLKAFFTEKPVHLIVGLDERANKELARILRDYAHERWAAHRAVNPLLWRCVGPFIDAESYPDIRRIAASENSLEREAAALACSASSYPQAKELLNYLREQKAAIETGVLTWDTVARKQAETQKQ